MPYYPPSSSGGDVTPTMANGVFYCPSGPRGTGSTTTNKVYYVRKWLRVGTLDRLTFFADSGTTATRLGIYADSAGKPGALVVDGGTVAVAGVGQYSITIATSITAAGYYWLAIATQGGGNAIQRHSIGAGDGPNCPALAANTGVGGGWVSTGTEAGALPGTAAAVTEEQPFVVAIRYSA